jgi:hypothetical protein
MLLRFLLAVALAAETTAPSSPPTPDFQAANVVSQAIPIDSRFPDPKSCPPFQANLEDLYRHYSEGHISATEWKAIAEQHLEDGNSFGSKVGAMVSHPYVQMGAAAGVVAGTAVAVGYVISAPAAILFLVVAGGVAYFYRDRIAQYRNEIEIEREKELRRVDVVALITRNEEYDREFIWPEQVERFKRLTRLNGDNLGLPSYAGGYKAFPVGELSKVIADQFLYFQLRTKLLVEGYAQLENGPPIANHLYVQMSTQQHTHMIKLKVASALAETYEYQAELALATATSLIQACGLRPAVAPKP